MIKAVANLNDGTQLLVIGLSHTNLDRLREGKPIHFRGALLGLLVDVMVFAGETEASMTYELESLIGPETRVSTDGRLKN